MNLIGDGSWLTEPLGSHRLKDSGAPYPSSARSLTAVAPVAFPPTPNRRRSRPTNLPAGTLVLRGARRRGRKRHPKRTAGPIASGSFTAARGRGGAGKTSLVLWWSLGAVARPVSRRGLADEARERRGSALEEVIRGGCFLALGWRSTSKVTQEWDRNPVTRARPDAAGARQPRASPARRLREIARGARRRAAAACRLLDHIAGSYPAVDGIPAYGSMPLDDAAAISLCWRRVGAQAQ